MTVEQIVMDAVRDAWGDNIAAENCVHPWGVTDSMIAAHINEMSKSKLLEFISDAVEERLVP